jgi:hypothetical protein
MTGKYASVVSEGKGSGIVVFGTFRTKDQVDVRERRHTPHILISGLMQKRIEREDYAE